MFAPDIELTVFVSTLPSGNITDNVALFDASKFVEAVSSTVITVVVALFIRPPVLSQDLTGSATLITAPTRTKVPASKVVVNETTSPSLACV